MTDPELRCPHCEQHGFVLPARQLVDVDELLGVMCHCCGYFMDKDELAKALDKRLRPRRFGA